MSQTPDTHPLRLHEMLVRLLPWILVILAPLAYGADEVSKKKWGQITIIEKKQVKVPFTDAERKLIREFYAKPGRRPANSQRGVRRRAELEAGWQKHMDKGNVIPDAVWSRRHPLPIALSRKLQKQPEGVVTVYIEGRIVRVTESARVILDVFGL